MINFDAVDFSEHCSEEVISFFWRSVYLQAQKKFRHKYSFPQFMALLSMCSLAW